MFISWSSSMRLFFVYNLFVFCSDLKSGWEVKEYRNIFLFKSYLAIQIWESFQRIQHGKKKGYKISLIYFLVTQFSKCKLKIQTMSTYRCHSRVYFHCVFRKGEYFFCVSLVAFLFLISIFFWFNQLFSSLWQSLTAFR